MSSHPEQLQKLAGQFVAYRKDIERRVLPPCSHPQQLRIVGSATAQGWEGQKHRRQQSTVGSCERKKDWEVRIEQVNIDEVRSRDDDPFSD
jgi:hypothetical protein